MSVLLVLFYPDKMPPYPAIKLDDMVVKYLEAMSKDVEDPLMPVKVISTILEHYVAEGIENGTIKI